METKDSDEVARANIANGRRVLIRLKHSLAADEVIETFLPESLEDFEHALARGDLEELRAKLEGVA